MSTHVPPERTPEQRTEALALALEARQARALVKEEVKAGQRTVASVLDAGLHGSGDHVLGHMELGELLIAVDGIGPSHAARILEAAGFDDERHLDTLGVHEAQTIKDAFQEVMGSSAG